MPIALIRNLMTKDSTQHRHKKPTNKLTVQKKDGIHWKRGSTKGLLLNTCFMYLPVKSHKVNEVVNEVVVSSVLVHFFNLLVHTFST